MELILLAVGLAALLAGGELLVRGASHLAALYGISPLVIGLTVVSFGTSAPELAVSLQSAIGGYTGLAVGNVVGSNIYNVLLVLGLSALVAPLLVKQQLVRLDVPLMIGASLLFWALASDGVLSLGDGLILVGLLGVYLVSVYRLSRGEQAEVIAEYEQEFGYHPTERRDLKLRNFALVAAGALLLVFGASWLVDGAVTVAENLGVSDLVIGLTVVAIGTSLPELITSVVAAIRGERDIAVGNVVGSNIFNLLSVIGLTAVLAPAGIAVSQVALTVDIPFMVAVSVACLPFFVTGRVVARWEGMFLLLYGVAYTVFVVLAAYGSGLPPLAFAALLAIAPLAVISLLMRQRTKESS